MHKAWATKTIGLKLLSENLQTVNSIKQMFQKIGGVGFCPENNNDNDNNNNNNNNKIIIIINNNNDTNNNDNAILYI